MTKLKEKHIDCQINTLSPTMVEIVVKKGKHLSWDEVQENQIPYDVIESNSGNGYPDQTELTWEKLTEMSQSPKPLLECTTLTKLPRRVFTPSKINIEESIIANQTNGKIFLSLNFVNYIASSMYRRTEGFLDGKVQQYIYEYFQPVIEKFDNVELKYLGTSEFTEDTLVISSGR